MASAAMGRGTSSGFIGATGSVSPFSSTTAFEREFDANIKEFAALVNQHQLRQMKMKQVVQVDESLALPELPPKYRNPISYDLSGGTQVARSCSVLMNEDHVLGELGQYVSQLLLERPEDYVNLLEGGSLSRHCDRYPNLNLKQKAAVWVLILTAMAHFESSCNIASQAQGPNGLAVGYFQLHHDEEERYDGKLDACVKGDGTTAHGSARCALGMLELQMIRTEGKLFADTSYWDVLRPNGASQRADIIRAAIQSSSLCRVGK